MESKKQKYSHCEGIFVGYFSTVAFTSDISISTGIRIRYQNIAFLLTGPHQRQKHKHEHKISNTVALVLRPSVLASLVRTRMLCSCLCLCQA